MLAQIDSVPIQLAAWLGCLAFFVGMVNQLMKLNDRMRGKGQLLQQPVMVQEQHDYATERDCMSRAAEVRHELEKLRMERAQDVKEASVSRKGMYEKMDSVRDEIFEMERRLNAADELRAKDIHNRFNDMLIAVGELRGKTQARP